MVDYNLMRLLRESNLSFIPFYVSPDGKKKRPELHTWDMYKEEPPEYEILEEWTSKSGLALVTGDVSGGLECLDFDCKNDVTGTLWDDFRQKLNTANIDISQFCIQKTKNNGYHLIYRSDARDPGKKIACNHDNEVIIETRGERQLVAIYPCDGYELINGSWDNIPHISLELRERLFSLSKMFDQSPINTTVLNEGMIRPRQVAPKNLTGEQRPGDVYDERITREEFVALFTKHGWKVNRNASDGVVYLTRPGKDTGVSASLFYEGRNMFYNFSSSVSGFEPDSAYSAFSCLGILEYNQNWSEAAKYCAKLYDMPATRPTPVSEFAEAMHKEAAKQVMNNMVEVEPQVRYEEKQANTWEGNHGNGKKPTAAALAIEWVTANYCIRYNLMLNIVQFAVKNKEQDSQMFGQPYGSWMDVDDRILKNWSTELELWSGKPVEKSKLQQYLVYMGQSYDPIKTWFDNLKPDYDAKKEQDYIAALAACVRTETQDKFTRDLRKWLIGTYATGYYTADSVGTINENFLVLTGGQGVGKTTFLRYLVPDALNKYKHEGTVEDTKDSKIQMARAWISINDELNTMRKTANEYLKSLLSSREIQYRPPYAVEDNKYPRRVNFCGSTNLIEFLSDHTGNRRYMVHNVLQVDRDALERIDIERVWAQAKSLFGVEPHYYTKEEIEENETSLIGNTTKDVSDDYLNRYFINPAIFDDSEPILHNNMDLRHQIRSITFADFVRLTLQCIEKDKHAPLAPRHEDLNRMMHRSVSRNKFKGKKQRDVDGKVKTLYRVIVVPQEDEFTF
jgi:hypothetical protein